MPGIVDRPWRCGTAVFPFLSPAAAFLPTDLFATDFRAGTFFATLFFFAAGLAGIGMLIPGMFMCCAAAGAEVIASASALATANN